jgi:hypothetical protein
MADVSFTADIAAIRDRARRRTSQQIVTDDPAARRMLEYRVPEQAGAGGEAHADDMGGLCGA